MHMLINGHWQASSDLIYSSLPPNYWLFFVRGNDINSFMLNSFKRGTGKQYRPRSDATAMSDQDLLSLHLIQVFLWDKGRIKTNQTSLSTGNGLVETVSPLGRNRFICWEDAIITDLSPDRKTHLNTYTLSIKWKKKKKKKKASHSSW